MEFPGDLGVFFLCVFYFFKEKNGLTQKSYMLIQKARYIHAFDRLLRGMYNVPELYLEEILQKA